MTVEGMNTPASEVWQQVIAELSKPLATWRQKGISSVYAPRSKEFHLVYRGYGLVLRLEETAIVASIVNPDVALAGLPKPQRFHMAGELSSPSILEGEREWTFSAMFDDLIAWFRRAVDEDSR